MAEAQGQSADFKGAALARRFHSLTAQWKKDTEFLSSATKMSEHPAYQAIIGMGKTALPFIFDALRHEPDHWFVALRQITGENPVIPDDRGYMLRMTQAWLQWADRNGY